MVGWTGAHPNLSLLGGQDAHTQIWELASVHRSWNMKNPDEADGSVGVLSGKGECEEHKQGTKFKGVFNGISYASIHK